MEALPETYSLTIAHLLMLLAAALGIYFAAHLWFSSSYRKRSNRILALFFVPFIFLEWFSFVADLEMDIAYDLLFIFTPIALAWGPTLFLYLKSLSRVKGVNMKLTRDGLHYWLPGILLLINIPLLVIIRYVGKEADLYGPAVTLLHQITLPVLYVVFPLQNLLYIILSLRLYLQHNNTFVEYFSFDEGVNLRWMRNSILVYIVFILGVVGTVIFTENLPEEVFHGLVLCFLVYVGFNGTRQVNFYFGYLNAQQRSDALNQIIPKSLPKGKHARLDFAVPKTPETDPEEATTSVDTSDAETAEKYSGSSLKEADRIEAIKQQLLDYMEAEKPYLNNQLTIFDIAKELEMNNKYISQVVNQDIGVNFISFINGYRVEEAKNLLIDPEMEQYTIEGLAQMAGFKSKSTFNAAFKKFTGKTPSAYRKEQLSKV